MLSVLIGGLVLILQQLTLSLFTCNRIANRNEFGSQRNPLPAGASRDSTNTGSQEDRQEENNVEVSYSKTETMPEDSVRLLSAKKALVSSKSKSGKKIDSESSHTEIIVVPVGKAQRAVVTHTNLTEPSQRKRDTSISKTKTLQRVVKFVDEKTKNNSERKRIVFQKEKYVKQKSNDDWE